MAFTTLACRIFYVYYGVMAYMFMFQTETQIKMFEYVSTCRESSLYNNSSFPTNDSIYLYIFI